MSYLRLIIGFERFACQYCEGIVWPWQARHRLAHTRCAHKNREAQWLNNVAAGYGPAVIWPCGECGAR